MSEDDRPLTDAELAELKRIIGPRLAGGGSTDTVLAARRWCTEHSARIEFSGGRYMCLRGGEVLATTMDLAVLLAKLERLRDLPNRDHP